MKVVSYDRVSTQAQVDEGTSLDEQKKRCRDECKRLGHEFIKHYSDDGFSGGSIERRGALQNLISEAKLKNFDMVVFTKLDRIGRDQLDILNVLNILEKCGLEINCLDEPMINSGNPMREMALGMLSTFA